MRRITLTGAVALLLITAACAPNSGASGEVLFRTHCAGCHPDGGNTIRPGKTLSRAHREANGIRTAGDVASFIRNPGPGMPAFPEGMIPREDAERIGKYVVTTFR